jgi:hypothetical protein
LRRVIDDTSPGYVILIMSSSEDSETAEWEREQMLRGTQSRARHQGQNQRSSNQRSNSHAGPQVDHKPEVIDASLAKRHVQLDIEQVENEIEVIKRNIGSARLDLSRSKKQLDAMLRQIEKLEAANPLFEDLQKLTDPSQIIELFDKHRQTILRLPEDQKEMIDLLEGRLRNSEVPMVVDQDD